MLLIEALQLCYRWVSLISIGVNSMFEFFGHITNRPACVACLATL